jgi:PIN domain nuclease of toxin-antitoxin system
VLADTHVILWWLANDARLSPRARELLAEGGNEVLWSASSSFEVAVKIAAGKLDLGVPMARFLALLYGEQGLTALAIRDEHCAELAGLPLLHRDPFDRMLVAQARVEGVPVLTADPWIAAYKVEIVW